MRRRLSDTPWTRVDATGHLQPLSLDSSTLLPLAIGEDVSSRTEGSPEELQKLSKLLTQLRDVHAFTVPGEHALVFHFLLGRHPDGVWAGLTGVGVET